MAVLQNLPITNLMKKRYLTIIILLILSAVLFFFTDLSPFNLLNKRKISLDKNTSKKVETNIQEAFSQNKITEPPVAVTLLLLKKEAIAEIWITDQTQHFHQILKDSIPFIPTQNGTKLFDTEPVIPEGVYEISTVHSDENISFTINFPNEFDRSKQQADKRPELLSTISIGTKNEAVILSENLMNEFLFLAKSVDVENATIIILPNDFRNNKAIPTCSTCPQWIGELYGRLRIVSKDYSK